ncbi:MAG: OsmC family protein [Rhodocyclaceae bacterium]|nr:OsmC family protein [Rhodocyclaceae bacterium]
MNADDLRAIQAPLKSRYRDDPGTALITLAAHGKLSEGVACSVETGKALVTAGLHPASGGSGSLACSGDMLLQALVACAGVTISAVATALGIEIRDGSLIAEGDLDFRGTLGVDRDAPVGFRAIRLKVRLDSDAPAESIDKLMQLSERYCVVLQTIANGVPVALEVAR